MISSAKFGFENLLQPEKPTRPSALAGDQIEDRMKTYGDPKEKWDQIAALWNAILGDKLEKPLAAADALQMMRLVKESRLSHSPEHFDSLVDVCGYADLQFIQTYKAPLASISGIDKTPNELFKARYPWRNLYTGEEVDGIDKVSQIPPPIVSPEEVQALLETPVTTENVLPGIWVKIENDNTPWCVLGCIEQSNPVYHLARHNKLDKTECRDVYLAEITKIV